MSNPPQKAVCSTRNKSKKAPNEKVLFHENLGSRSKTWGKRLCFGRESPVFEESMKERGSMYEHFPLCGSAWAAIWGRLLTKEFSNTKSFFRKVDVFRFLGGWLWVFPKRFRWVCKDFGWEPWRKMMRRGQLSLLSNQINSFPLKSISFTRICRKSGFRKKM